MIKTMIDYFWKKKKKSKKRRENGYERIVHVEKFKWDYFAQSVGAVEYTDCTSAEE